MKTKVIDVVSVAAVVFTFVILGMLPIVMPAVKKPEDRVFNGMHGYLDDYVGYASYVKEGIYGRLTFRIRSLPKNQSPTSANLIYVWAGYIARICKFTAPTGYHVMRAFLGAIFVYITYYLLKLLLQHHWHAMCATMLAFSSSSLAWFVKEGERWVYTPLSTFSFIDNVAGRVTTRLHYQLGAILFLYLGTVLFIKKKQHISSTQPDIIKKYAKAQSFFILFLLGFLLGITHPTFALVFGVVVGMLFVFERLLPRPGRAEIIHFILTGIGIGLGLLLSKWSTSQEPYVSILAFEEYTRTQTVPLRTTLQDIITFGPTLWIGFFGLLWGVVKSKGKNTKDLFMLFWLLIQFLMFFSLFSLFRAERFRFIQSLYFIPMAYGTVVIFRELSKKIGKWFVYAGTIFLMILFVPSYIHGFQTDYFALTDYKTYYPSLYFPFKTHREAYEYLDKNTPTESVVVASFEAANNIILYSHNYVIGNTQGWPKEPQKIMIVERDNFFSGMMSTQAALEYVNKHDIAYVYNGWQEKTLGDVTRYPFLEKVFDNTEVQIYRVEKGQ